MDTTRTVSPYFSPNRAMAPFFLASSMGSTSVWTLLPMSTMSLTMALTRPSSSGVRAEKWVKSKRRRSGSTREPDWWTWSPSTERRAASSRWVAEWARMMA